MKYYGYDPANNTDTSSTLGIYLKPGSKLTGVQTQPEYDYSALGETWSSPRIIRLPNNGAGDTNIEDDIYVAIMGGGFGGCTFNLVDINNKDVFIKKVKSLFMQKYNYSLEVLNIESSNGFKLF